MEWKNCEQRSASSGISYIGSHIPETHHCGGCLLWGLLNGSALAGAISCRLGWAFGKGKGFPFCLLFLKIYNIYLY